MTSSTLRIERYTHKHVEGVAALNRRLHAAGSVFRFPKSPVPSWLPPRPGSPVYQEYFVVCDGTGVHGGYILKPQPFVLMGQVVTAADYRMPLSEGIIEPRYGLVGLLTLKDAMRRQEYLFGLGMRSRRQPVARLLSIAKWKFMDCGFFFRVCRPGRFLRGISFLRNSARRRTFLDALAVTGAGWLGLRAVQGWKTRPGSRGRGIDGEEFTDFGPWSDELWERAKAGSSFIAVRDAAVLRTLYPDEEKRFHKIRVHKTGSTVGWAVVLDTMMKSHRQFGDLRVGSVIDCLALPGEEQAVVWQATRFLEDRGVDLIVSNQSHVAWKAAFCREGYLKGPSNFIFAAGPALARRLEPFDVQAQTIHMTRGDGDGPINL